MYGNLLKIGTKAPKAFYEFTFSLNGTGIKQKKPLMLWSIRL